MNNMIANPEKFQAIIIDKNNNPTEKINSESTILLLGLEIDSKLNFDKHISKLCNKSAAQLNTLKATVMQTEEALINDGLPVSKLSLKFRSRTSHNFAVIYP